MRAFESAGGADGDRGSPTGTDHLSRLGRLRRERSAEVEHLLRELREDRGGVPEEDQVLGDGTDAVLARLLDRLVREIRDIDAAIARCCEGLYGLCRDCGRSIHPRRLRDNPAVQRCRTCQQSAERHS